MQDNIKVHFVAGHQSGVGELICFKAAKVNYYLYSAYPFISNTSSDSQMDTAFSEIVKLNNFNHIILDSGLFTLMFGAGSGQDVDKQFIREWMHRIVSYVNQNNLEASIVECDCQKLISPDFAWDLRKEMRELLPNKEIINVFHVEDGEDGFKKLVEFSDYIAISVPELRKAHRGKYKETTHQLARLARKIKPDIKIHLLGCTEKNMLLQNRFCTSADSSSWGAGFRFNNIGGYSINFITEEKREEAKTILKETALRYGYPIPKSGVPVSSAYTSRYYSLKYWVNQYIRYAGQQN